MSQKTKVANMLVVLIASLLILFINQEKKINSKQHNKTKTQVLQ